MPPDSSLPRTLLAWASICLAVISAAPASRSFSCLRAVGAGGRAEGGGQGRGKVCGRGAAWHGWGQSIHVVIGWRAGDDKVSSLAQH